MELIKSRTYQNMISQIIEMSKHKLTILNGKTIIVTGATGMLGSCIVDALVLWNQKQSTPVKIVAVSRREASAKKRFGYCWNESFFSFIEQDICREIHDFPKQVDYIIHAASNGDPVNFSKNPTETILANILGSHFLLNYGKEHGLKRFLYISSGEVYGDSNDNLDKFSEKYYGSINLSTSRACYPEGKRAAEVLCQCYLYQYHLDSVILRPCHLFGPTMTRQDSRAVSQFLWNAVRGENIVLKSSGDIERSHCYIADAVTAVFWVLKDGESGKAYNIADPKYQMTIREFAEKSAEYGNSKIVFENPSSLEINGYSQRKRAVLSSLLLESLGWKPQKRSHSAILETIQILRESEKI